MMIKNKPRNASSRVSRGFFMPWVGNPTGPVSIRRFKVNAHHTGIPV
jgi:hypothetical protein